MLVLQLILYFGLMVTPIGAYWPVSPFSTTDDLLNANCTSCEITQDKSAYWSPQLYFYDTDNKSYEMVPEVEGHITYYKYVPAFISSGQYVNPIAIPNGMKMLSGNTFRRNFTLAIPDPPLPWSGADISQDALQQKAIGFNCLNYNQQPEDTLKRHFLPSKTFMETKCPDGIRLEVLFPICWNGEDLTSSSPNYTSHVAYSSAGANGGSCPAGYDVVINQLLYETIYPTGSYIGRNGFYTLSNGDPTGYGYHGDAFIAWEGDIQQQATEICGDPVTSYGKLGIPSECPVFNVQPVAAQTACKLKHPANANVLAIQGPLSALPGDNPIQYGPHPATPPAGDSAPVQSPPAPPVAAPSPPQIVSVKAPAPSSTTVATTTSTRSTSSTAGVTPMANAPASPSSDGRHYSTTTFLADGVLDALVQEVVTVTDVLWVDAAGSPVPVPVQKRHHSHEHVPGRRQKHRHHNRG